MNRLDSPRKTVFVPVFNEEKLLPGTLEALYAQEGVSEFTTIIVDNASTDRTREVIDRFSSEHPDFDLRVVEESRKGTGYACRAGAEAARRLGADIIARTDGDAIPSLRWLASAVESLSRPEKQMATGPIRARRDEFYRAGDRLLVPTIEVVGRLLKATFEDPVFIKTPIGFNTAIKSEAYEAVGGYPMSSIEDLDEDSELSKRVKEAYGMGAFDYNWNMQVATSTRRLHAIGIWGMMKCHVIHPDTKEVRLEVTGGDVDIR